jgi:hypothetical protein
MKLRLICAVVSFQLMALTAFAQMGTQKEGLRGLSGLSVTVKSLSKTVMTDDQLQVRVELRLRRSGITVNECKAGTICLPQLYVKLVAIGMGGEFDVKYCLITIECNNFVVSTTQPSRRLIATVWFTEDSVLTLKDEYKPLGDKIDELIDGLANDYLAANPRSQP